MEQPFDYRSRPILVVDDEPDILETFRFSYERDFTIHTATSGAEALEIIAAEPIAALITDQRMPQMSGLELVREAATVRPSMIALLLTGYADVQALVDAINLRRIHRYISKPWDRYELRQAICRALEAYDLTERSEQLTAENVRLLEKLRVANERLDQENRYLKARETPGEGFDLLVGRSAALARVVDVARRVADAPTTVLIEGETGTGKELLARAIHAASSRRDRLFVAVNTGAVPETLLQSELFGHRRGAFTDAKADRRGHFEMADGGTIFLDEIGEISPAFQVHLLRALQEGEIMPVGATRPVKVDVRVVAATNRDLEREVREGRFREDLFFRLRVVRLRMPPLRDRVDDIPLLVEHLIALHAQRLAKRVAGITPEATAALQGHAFRGNVRELANMIERAVLLCRPGEPIQEDDLFEHPLDASLPSGDGAPRGVDEPLAEQVVRFECERIRLMMGQTGNNKSEAARRLGLTYHGLLKKMQRYGMVGAG